MFRRRPVVNHHRHRRSILATSGTAIAAAPGDPFKLGQDNTIASLSTTLPGAGQSVNGVLL